MGLLDTEVAKWKRAFGLLGGIPKTFKNNPRNAETMDAVFGFGGIIPGVGDAVSAAEAKYRYDQGDMLGAGLAGLGALPMVPALAGTFIGKKGINNLGLADVLKQAEAMEKAGKSRDEIWEATAQMAAKKGVPGGGIGRGVDKQWRFEISDKYDIIDSSQGAKEIGAHWKSGKDKHLSSLYEGGSPSITQHMAMSHDDLFKAYPELRATNLTGGADKSRGSFSGDTVTMRWDDIARASNPQKVEDLSEPMSTNLHELQHAIQQREGLARGGSPNSVAWMGDTATKRRDEINSIINSGKYTPDEYFKLLEEKRGLINNAEMTPYEAYRHLAGEAEARLTQSRMNMTPLDRQMFPPWSQKELGGYDVPEAQQIVRFGDGPAMNAPMRPSNASVGMSSKPKGWVSGWETRIDQPYLEGPPAPKRPLDTWGGYGTPEEYQAAQAAKQIADAEWAARTSQAQRNIRYGASRSPYAGGQSDKVYDRIAQDVPPYLNDRPRNHLGQEIPPTPYELAHAEAQRVAALPVEHGGLGLPPGNTAMDRARAMGFDTDAYHGTGKEVFDAFDPLISADNSHLSTGGRSWLSTSPKIASGFSGGMTFRDMYPISQYGAEGAGLKSIKVIPDPPYNVNAALEKNGYVMPLKINKSGEKSISNKETRKLMFEGNDDWRESGQELADAMGDNVITKLLGHPRSAYPELRATNYAVKDPSRIRSRFAAFNPAKRDSADLLSGLAPWALPVGATLLGGSFLLPPEEY